MHFVRQDTKCCAARHHQDAYSLYITSDASSVYDLLLQITTL